jgi:oxygen-independent coproporphyrinogen-3 oxidase
MTPAGLGLYVHVPFCARKCAYCPFYSLPLESGSSFDYLRCVISEIEALAGDKRLLGRPLTTAYIGGGTPSVLGAGDLKVILDTISNCFACELRELTVEANPESLNLDVVSAISRAPGGRLSLGVQSFHDEQLRVLGRGHDARAAGRAAAMATEAGLGCVSMDLIYGVPGQTTRVWESTLDSALGLGAGHISCYCLSLEAGTPLARAVEEGDIRPLEESEQREMYNAARSVFRREGFEHYEISNFAKPGHESQHNLGYWRRGEYVGAGPSAHSFLEGVRWWNVNDVDEYCRRISAGHNPIARREQVTHEQAIDETVMLALRTSEGLPLDRIRDVGGENAEDALLASARPLVEEGVLAARGRALVIPHDHWFVSDEIIARLLEARRRFRRAPAAGRSEDPPAEQVG